MATKPVKSFFDIINCLFEKNRPTNEEIEKHTTQWMVANLLSCDLALVPVAEIITKSKMSNYECFEFLWHILPKQKKFIKYNATKAKEDQDVQYIINFYKCSQKDARSYRELISKDEMKKITEFFENRGKK
jgi:hypothetical protein